MLRTAVHEARIRQFAAGQLRACIFWGSIGEKRGLTSRSAARTQVVTSNLGKKFHPRHNRNRSGLLSGTVGKRALSGGAADSDGQRNLITGMAHIVVVLDQWETSTPFYRSLFDFLGFSCVADTDRGHGNYDRTPFLYYVGGRTAVGFHKSVGEFEGVPFNQNRAGLHHWCLRARSAEAIDEVEAHFHEHLRGLGGKLVRPAQGGGWAPGYYSILMEDPEGQRVELNHVPGRG